MGHAIERLRQCAQFVGTNSPEPVFQFPAATSRAAPASCSTGRVTREAAHPLNRMASTDANAPRQQAQPNESGFAAPHRDAACCPPAEFPADCSSCPLRGMAWTLSSSAGSSDQCSSAVASCRCCCTCSISGASFSGSRTPPEGAIRSCGENPFARFRIEHGPHSSRKFQAPQELLVQPASADYPQRPVADLHFSDRGKPERRAVRKFLLPEKCALRRQRPRARELSL